LKPQDSIGKKPTYKELEAQIKIIEKDKSEKLYRKIFTTMPQLFKVVELIYDKNGNAIDYYYRDVNKAFELFVKKTRKQLIDNRLNTIFDEIGTYWLDTYARIVKTGKKVSFENF